MSEVKCFTLENDLMDYNPTIELNDVFGIFLSQLDKKPIYIRFEIKNPLPNKRQRVDVYWVFDNFKEQIHNYQLVTKEFRKLFNNI